MGIFPEKYSKPELVSILRASELGWHASCPQGAGPTTGPPTCNTGNGAGPGKLDQGRLFDGGEGSSSSNSRLINPGDVSQGL